MAVGYEARAVVTADMSGFISGARNAAQAAEALGNAVNTLNEQLARNAQLGKEAASALKPMTDAANRFQDATRDSADAGQALRQAMQGQGEGINAVLRAQEAANDQTERAVSVNKEAAQSVSSLARNIFNTERALADLRTVTDGNYSSTQGITQATEAYNTELNRLQGQLAKRSEAEQTTVRRQIDLLDAQRTYQDVMRETGKEMNLLTGSLQRTGTELDAMGRRFHTLTQLQGRFQNLQSQVGVLTREQAQSYDAVNRALSDTQVLYSQLDERQQERVRRSEAEARSTELIRAANQRLAESARESARASREQAAGAQATASELNRVARQLEDYTQLQRQFQELQQRNGQLSAEQAASFRNIEAALSQAQSAYSQYSETERRSIDNTRNNIAASRGLSEAKRELAAAEREAASAGQQSDSIFNRQNVSMFALRSAVGDLDSTLADLQQSLLQVGRAMATAFAEQDVAIGQLARVTQETDEFVAGLTESFRQMSTQIPLAFAELAEIGRFGAQVGIANDQLVSFTRTVALFSSTTSVAGEEAATMFARVQQLTGLAQSQIPNMGAAISALGSNSAATEAQILKMTEQISTVAQQSELSATSVFGLASALASLGIRPELARGALQRTLFEIEQAAQGASSRTEGLAQAMGLTVDEMVTLRNSMSREDFFFTFLQGLEQSRTAGEDLNSVLREVGFRNVQDIQVLSVLGTNWSQVAQSIDLANTEFEANNFLQRESERLFERLTFQLQMTRNALANLGARVVESLAPLLIVLANIATSVLEWAAANDVVLSTLAAFTVVGAIVLALSSLARVVTFVSQGMLAWSTLMVTLRSRTTAVAASTSASTASLLANASASQVAAAQALGYTTVMSSALGRTAALSGVMTRLATATGAAAGGLARASAAATAFVTSGAAATTAARALNAAMLTIAPLAAIAAVVTLISTLQQLTTSAREANQAHLDAAGGIEVLTDAMVSDTQAALDNADALVYRRESIDGMSDEDRAAAEAARDLEHHQGVLSQQLGLVADNAEGAGSAVAESAREARSSSQGWSELEAAMLSTGVAIGEANQQFAAMTVQSVITETGILANAEAFSTFQDALRDFGGVGGVVEAELSEPASGADQTRQAIEQLQESMGGLERNLGFSAELLDTASFGLLDFRTESWLAVAALADLENGLDGLSQAQIEAINQMGLLEGELQVTDDGTVELVGGLNELEEGLSAAEAQAQETAEALGQIIGAARGAVDPLAALRHEGEVLSLSWDETFSRLAESMTDSLGFAFELAALQARGLSDAAVEFIASNRDIFGQHMGELSEMTDQELQEINEVLRFLAGDMDSELGEMFRSVQESAAATGDTAGVDIVQGIIEGMAQGEIDVQVGMEAIRSIAEGAIGLGDYEIDPELAEEDLLEAQIQGLIDHIEMLIDSGEYEFDLDSDGEDAIEESRRTRDSIEESAAQSTAIFRPAVESNPAREQMGVLTSGLKSMASGAAPKVEPSVERPPSEEEMSSLLSLLDTDASAADPTVKPSTDGRPAQNDMQSLVSNLLSMGRSADVVATPRVNGSTAYSGMARVMGRLRSIASSGVYVPIYPYQAGSISKSNLVQAAEGGWINGPGGPREDKVPAWLSNGEFVVSAKAARIWGSLLEDINAGAVPNMVLRDPRGTPDLAQDTSGVMSDFSASANLMRSVSAAPAPGVSSPPITIYNTYPQAEPTSTTINRSLQYAAVMEGATLG